MPNRNSIMMLGAVCTLIGVFTQHPPMLKSWERGIYLRGDLGWSWARDAEIVDKNFGLDGFIFIPPGPGRAS